MSKKDKKQLIKSKRSYRDFLIMVASGVGVRVQNYFYKKNRLPCTAKTMAILNLESLGWRD